MMMPRRAFAASSIGTVSTRGVLLGRLQQTLVKNAPFAVLAFFVSAVVFGGWIYSKVGTEADNLGDATFKAYSLLNDIPGADACAEETLPAKLLAQMLHIVGVFTFAVVLGIVCLVFREELARLFTSDKAVIAALSVTAFGRTGIAASRRSAGRQRPPPCAHALTAVENVTRFGRGSRATRASAASHSPAFAQASAAALSPTVSTSPWAQSRSAARHCRACAALARG